MKNNSKLRSWLDDLNLEHPLVIAGPCSAETESQVLQIAQDLKIVMYQFLELVFGSQEHALEILKVLDLLA